MECCHDDSVESTLRTAYAPIERDALGDVIRVIWVVFCRACGQYTHPCFIPQEAHERAKYGWWMGQDDEYKEG